MSVLGYRRLTVGMVVALIAVGVVAGMGPAFPRDVVGTTSWNYLATHAAPAAHALLGALTLIGAVAMTCAADRKLVPSLIVLGTATSVTAGMWYVQSRQPEAALMTMTVGWLIALAASVAELIGARRRTSSAA